MRPNLQPKICKSPVVSIATHHMYDYVIVCLRLATGLLFSLGSSTNKTDCHDITEILLSGVKHHRTNTNKKKLE